MRPLDPRLVRRVRPVRQWIVAAAVVHIANAGLLVSQALSLAAAITRIAQGQPWASITPLVGVFAASLLGRAGLAGLGQRLGYQASTRVITDLRAQLLASAQQRPHLERPADVTTLATSGLAGLESYLTQFLPHLIACSVITPALLVVTALLDPLSALLMVITLPLIPLFMALVGWTCAALSRQRLATMRRLGDQLLDLLAGLATLRAHGRAHAQANVVRTLGRDYQRSTMSVLRVAFLSGLVLELLATLSVALVAVGIGMRLVYGQMSLSTGLAVLILAPQVYLPLRLVGLHFHASTDGLAASQAALAFLDDQPPTDAESPEQATVIGPVTAVQWVGVSVAQPGRQVVAPHGLTGMASAGQITALVGANGSGKSTTIAATLGVGPLHCGQILLHTSTGTQPRPEAAQAQQWWSQVVWMPQQPVLLAASLAENLTLFTGPLDASQRERAAHQSGLNEVIATLAHGWDTRIGEGGVGLSAGQRQRLALTRAIIRREQGAHVVLCDEPNAHLDSASATLMRTLLRRWAQQGALVVLAAHHRQWVALADVRLPVHHRDQPTTVHLPPVAALTQQVQP